MDYAAYLRETADEAERHGLVKYQSTDPMVLMSPDMARAIADELDPLPSEGNTAGEPMSGGPEIKVQFTESIDEPDPSDEHDVYIDGKLLPGAVATDLETESILAENHEVVHVTLRIPASEVEICWPERAHDPEGPEYRDV